MNEFTTPALELPATTSEDVLTGILRDGAQRLLSQAVEAEVDTWIESHKHLSDERGRRQVVRNGHLPKRSIITGIGPVEVVQPRVLHRHGAGALDAHDQPVEPFRSKILPPYLRKTKSVEASGSRCGRLQSLGCTSRGSAPAISPSRCRRCSARMSLAFPLRR